mmetsp:Transcript_4299/g.4871  ORF Transcript_4299/g.4871 Transcript_4299/m.4871 type:complete len:658 (-) Transcript_4299:96-2069(-)
MPRFDLAFFLCCCRACLGSNDQNEESFYDLLGVERDATIDEIKRAYKRKSLDLHPDKLAQKGKVVTNEDQSRFTRMKEAYEVLSDTHKRETYDAIGERGMKWIEEPFSVDPQEMANNFASSSTLDRSKIFGIFLAIAIAIFILPILICLQIDGKFGADASWAAIATPLWIWNAFMIFYHVRVIVMGPLKKTDHIPEEEWFDPFPMTKRYLSFVRFLLFFTFEIMAVLNIDGTIKLKWSFIFIPIFLLELINLFRRVSQAGIDIITVEEAERIMGKPFAQFTQTEKENLNKKYMVVPSKTSPAYHAAKSLQESTKTDIMKISLRTIFFVLLLFQLDAGLDWSWWLVFTPFFVLSCCLCCGQCQRVSEAQAYAAEKLDAASNRTTGGTGNSNTETDYGAMEEGGINPDGNTGIDNLTEEEKAEIKSLVFQETSRLVTTCCTQFFSLILLCLCLGKMQGAGFSSLWIISPFLFIASLILCFLGCTIFCIAPIDEEYMNAAYQNMDLPHSPQQQSNVGTSPPPMDPEQSTATTTTTTTTIPTAATAPTATKSPVTPTKDFHTTSNDTSQTSQLLDMTGDEDSPPPPLPTQASTTPPPPPPPPTQAATIPTTPTIESTQPPIDLLDVNPVPVVTTQTSTPKKNNSNEARVFGPTESEVDDLD